MNTTMTPPKADRENPALKGKKILLVDDDQPMLSALTRVLTRAGANVDAAGGAAEAMAVLSDLDTVFDAVITDLRMPMASGRSVLSMVKTAHPEVPVIIMSGFWSEELKETCRELGCTHFLDKPLSSEEMIDAIASIVANREGEV